MIAKNSEHGTRADNGSARVILLLGAPGSGKGTQSAQITSQLGIRSISTGAMLREEAKRDTPAGFRLRQTMATGALVSDEIVCEVVASHLHSRTARESLILDGFPRTVRQARHLDRILRQIGMGSPLVVHLDVPNEVLSKRLSARRQCARCGAIYNLASVPSIKGSRCEIDGGALVERDDDSQGVIGRRLAEYEAETLPVIEYYRDADYRRIDGNRAPAEIGKELLEIVGFLAETAVAA